MWFGERYARGNSRSKIARGSDKGRVNPEGGEARLAQSILTLSPQLLTVKRSQRTRREYTGLQRQRLRVAISLHRSNPTRLHLYRVLQSPGDAWPLHVAMTAHLHLAHIGSSLTTVFAHDSSEHPCSSGGRLGTQCAIYVRCFHGPMREWLSNDTSP